MRNDARSVPESGSVYPMQKWISPSRIFGRKKSFCSCEPYRMIVGATELIVSIGTGAPARIDSSKKMNCSIWLRP